MKDYLDTDGLERYIHQLQKTLQTQEECCYLLKRIQNDFLNNELYANGVIQQKIELVSRQMTLLQNQLFDLYAVLKKVPDDYEKIISSHQEKLHQMSDEMNGIHLSHDFISQMNPGQIASCDSKTILSPIVHAMKENLHIEGVINKHD